MSVSEVVDHYLAGLFLCVIIHISVSTLQADMVYYSFYLSHAMASNIQLSYVANCNLTRTLLFYLSVFFSLLSTSIVLLTPVQWVILQAMKHIDGSFAVLMFGMTANLLTIFLYSFFGAFATTAFFTYGECIYGETCWYQLPLVLQKYLIHMIRNSQIEMHYTGNNLFVLNLALFTRVSMK